MNFEQQISMTLFCMINTRDDTVITRHNTYRYEGRRYDYLRYDTGSCFKNKIIHNIHILIFIITLTINTTEEGLN